MADDNAFSVYADRAGQVWIGTYRRGSSASIRTTGRSARRSSSARRKRAQIRVITEASTASDADRHDARHVSGVGLVEYDRAAQERSSFVGNDGLSASRCNAIVETEPGHDLDRHRERARSRRPHSGKIQHFTEADGCPAPR
jgi:hypothetical protein